MTYDKNIADLFLMNFNESYRSAKLLAMSLSRIEEIIPLNSDSIQKLSADEMDILDAFRVRFCDLQDFLGSKTFRSILKLEEEQIGTQLDVINKMEKRGIIKSFDEWKEIRDIRNLFSHDYPDSDDQRAESINIAYSVAPKLLLVLDNLKKYVEDHIQLPMEQFDFLCK